MADNGNTSHAVMSQRSEAHDSLDDFPTPPWAVRDFVNWLDPAPHETAWEPAANRGFMVKALAERFGTVHATDVHDYGAGFPTHDFLLPGPPLHEPDWIITNPPFRLAEEFVQQALSIARVGVAILVRSVWAEGAGRYTRLFNDIPPHAICQHVNRVPMVRGRYDTKASTATAYSWFVWRMEIDPGHTDFHWLPGSEARLYRHGDEIPMGTPTTDQQPRKGTP